MPLFDYICPACRAQRVDVLVPRHDTPVTCGQCGYQMEKQPAAPSFKVQGFNAETGYASPRTMVSHRNGIRTEVKGHFEAFDRLHG